jgi:hypothetical protein
MTIRAKYTYEPLVSSEDPSFDAMYSIYEESIPIRERKSKAQISAITRNPEYKILLLKDDGRVIGFSIIFAPQNEMFCLLEYMAIHASYRSMGLGQELFLRTFKANASIDESIIGLIEVESDREQSADQKNRIRRQSFYRRLGCLRIEGLSYVMPLVGEGLPPQMDILVYLSGRLPTISKHQLKRWMEVIYNKVYGYSRDDSRIAQMIEPLDNPIKLA